MLILVRLFVGLDSSLQSKYLLNLFLFLFFQCLSILSHDFDKFYIFTRLLFQRGDLMVQILNFVGISVTPIVVGVLLALIYFVFVFRCAKFGLKLTDLDLHLFNLLELLSIDFPFFDNYFLLRLDFCLFPVLAIANDTHLVLLQDIVVLAELGVLISNLLHLGVSL